MLRWRAAGKNGGTGACNDREGVFRLPTDRRIVTRGRSKNEQKILIQMSFLSEIGPQFIHTHTSLEHTKVNVIEKPWKNLPRTYQSAKEILKIIE